jgi:heptosyltransferase-2
MKPIRKILIIQTASIGDVILATPVIEALHKSYPNAMIDFLMKDGFQDLLERHPHLHHILGWNKKKDKYGNLRALIKYVRNQRYDMVVNLQRFFSTGLITAFSGASVRAGFSKNPLSFMFTHRAKHLIGNDQSTPHETQRNLSVVNSFTNSAGNRPALYPDQKAFAKVSQFKTGKYICIAPASLWFTKQYPKEKWVDFIDKVPTDTNIILLGSRDDRQVSRDIIKNTSNDQVLDLCGNLTLLESAALIRDASMNYVNDSAVLHLCSAMNAPVTAVFCSTVPAFGFGPLSDDSAVVEVKEQLSCRPCGLHGKSECPEGHFKCAKDIDNDDLLNRLK